MRDGNVCWMPSKQLPPRQHQQMSTNHNCSHFGMSHQAVIAGGPGLMLEERERSNELQLRRILLISRQFKQFCFSHKHQSIQKDQDSFSGRSVDADVPLQRRCAPSVGRHCCGHKRGRRKRRAKDFAVSVAKSGHRFVVFIAEHFFYELVLRLSLTRARKDFVTSKLMN